MVESEVKILLVYGKKWKLSFYRLKYYESRTISIHNVKSKAKFNNLNAAARFR